MRKATFGTRQKSRAEINQAARDRWYAWRLVLDAGMSYDDVFHHMTPDEINEANEAYTILLKERSKAAERAAKRK